MVFYANSHPRGRARSASLPASRPVGRATIIPLSQPEPGYQREPADEAHARAAAAAEDAGRPAA
jgi:hypothetical protein